MGGRESHGIYSIDTVNCSSVVFNTSRGSFFETVFRISQPSAEVIFWLKYIRHDELYSSHLTACEMTEM